MLIVSRLAAQGAQRDGELKHPNIVEVFEHGEHRGHYLVMELVDGPRPLDALGEIEIARALTCIHRTDPKSGRKPLILFDVSPQNILVGWNGVVKLSDFGLARALRKTGAETITHTKGKRASSRRSSGRASRSGAARISSRSGSCCGAH